MVKKVGVVTQHFYRDIKNHVPEASIIQSLQEIPSYDLVIFTGGSDISPAWYGRNEISRSYGISTERDAKEISSLAMALRYSYIKILGICRGHQLINAHLGGKMVEDLSELGVTNHGGGGHVLENVTPGSIVAKYFSLVNSLHHQAVISPGRGLNTTSKIGDIIESTESKRILTTQFHPEMMANTEDFWKFLVNEW